MSGSAEVCVAEYTLTVDDFVAYSLYVVTQSPFKRRSFIVRRLLMFTAGPVALALFILPAFLVDPALFPGGAIPSWTDLLVLAVALSIALGSLAWWYSLHEIRRLAVKTYNEESFAPWRDLQRLEISEAGLAWAGVSGSSHVRWSAVAAVETSPAGAFLFVNSEQALMAPVSAFSDRGAMEAFAALAERFRKQAVGRNQLPQ